MPCFFGSTRIPPKIVLNDILRTGIDDAGMSGGVKWEPFQLSEEEYLKVRDALEERGLVFVEPPGWVKSKSDWHIWEMEVDHGIPADEHRRLSEPCEKLEKEMERAVRENRKGDANLLHMQYLEVANELAKFFNSHSKKR